jgi:HlyD family secretion protein
MNFSKSRAVLLSAVAAAAVGFAVYAYYQRSPAATQFEGWIEAELLFISPDETGRVETLSVREGDEVKAGAPLFTLDADLQRAAVAENEAAVTNARQSYDRAKALLQKAVGSQKAFDDAESALRTAEARLNSAKTRLDRRTMLSAANGTIQEVYFRVGEMVMAGRPIVSLLPPRNVKVRFFVPQAVLPTVHIDDRIAIRCDGCARDLTARVRFISAQAEFTPPIIYSREERARLVFRVEAYPDQLGALKVGQPVTVLLQSSAGAAHAHK